MQRLNSGLLALLWLISCSAWGAELATKYNFVPSHQQLYRAAVVKPAKINQPLPTAIIAPPTANGKKKPLQVQVVMAKNYASVQPLAPTISYSYAKPASSIAPPSVVVAAKNYSAKVVNLTRSDLNADSVQTYVVGYAGNNLGYYSHSKGPLQKVQLDISNHPLVGCAPLSLNCSRTATDSNSLDIERGPLKPEQLEQKARQQIKP